MIIICSSWLKYAAWQWSIFNRKKSQMTIKRRTWLITSVALLIVSDRGFRFCWFCLIMLSSIVVQPSGVTVMSYSRWWELERCWSGDQRVWTNHSRGQKSGWCRGWRSRWLYKVQILPFCTEVDFSGICTLLEYLLTFLLHIWAQTSELSPLVIFQTDLLLQFECFCLPGWAQDVLPTQHVSVWHSGNETRQSTHFLVRSGTARTNPTDSPFEFNSLCIIWIWQKCPSEGNFSLWYSEFLSQPALYYSDWSKDESVFLLLPESFFTQVSVLKKILCVLLSRLWVEQEEQQNCFGEYGWIFTSEFQCVCVHVVLWSSFTFTFLTARWHTSQEAAHSALQNKS